MSTTLYFKMEEVAPLIEHALQATEHRGTSGQIYDENFKLLENPIIPPGLIFVKDSGIYLLSNGKLGKEKTPIDSGLISFAVGFNPQKDADVYEKSRFAVGGDDFTQALVIDEFFKERLRREDGYFYLTIHPEYFDMGWSPNRG